jgi:DNA-binding transcriptional ArsR family regulator
MSQSPSSSTEAQATNDSPAALGSVDDSLDAIFEVLAAERRRHVLYALYRRSGPVSLSDLAEEVASHENTEADRIAASLHHVHLPKLVSANAAEYDPEEGAVRLRARSDRLYRHLSAAAEDEARPLRRAAGSATLSEF